MDDAREGTSVSQQDRYSRRKRRLPITLAGVFLAVLGMGVFLFYQFIYRVEPAFDSIVCELGDEISDDVQDYLLGTKWSVGRGELDISQVNTGNLGVYQAYVRHGRKEFQYEIIVQDTISPDIHLKDQQIYLEQGREYRPEELIEGVEDADRHVKLFFQESGSRQDTLKYTSTGSYDCTVAAEDLSGNRSVAEISVTVDKAPEIDGVQDIYLALGCQADYLDQVTAWDETDGDLTDRITVDDELVQLSREGTYKLSYRVKDNFGLENVSYADVVVAAQEDLQELVGTRQVDRHRDRIIGAINPYDAGASERDNIRDALDYMLPAVVQLYHETDTHYSAGSGYIMEITDDTVYICSDRHVAEEYSRWDVYFFDGTRVKGTTLGCSDTYDVGVVTVKRKDIPSDLLDQLMTIHIDRSYWNELDDQRIRVGLERVDRQGGIKHTTTGYLVKIKQYFSWDDQKEHTEVTLKLEHGDSGSAVVDGHGNLVGMAYAYSEQPRRDWCVPLDAILDCYEVITGHSVYVY